MYTDNHPTCPENDEQEGFFKRDKPTSLKREKKLASNEIPLFFPLFCKGLIAHDATAVVTSLVCWSEVGHSQLPPRVPACLATILKFELANAAQLARDVADKGAKVAGAVADKQLEEGQVVDISDQKVDKSVSDDKWQYAIVALRFITMLPAGSWGHLLCDVCVMCV
jgi:hypothetical protein